MIKFRAAHDEGHIVGLGLSHENLKRLKGGQPIRINAESIGLPGTTILIFAGRTEQTMASQLREFITADTQVYEAGP